MSINCKTHLSFQGSRNVKCIFGLGLILIILFGFVSCTDRKAQSNNSPSLDAEKDQNVNPRLIWSLDTGSLISTSPAFDEGIVYFTNDAGYLYALNAIDGSIKWIYQIGRASCRERV